MTKEEFFEELNSVENGSHLNFRLGKTKNEVLNQFIKSNCDYLEKVFNEQNRPDLSQAVRHLFVMCLYKPNEMVETIISPKQLEQNKHEQ